MGLFQLEQIQDIPVSAYAGNVQFFNQGLVTVCNTTTKTLLGQFQFDTDLRLPKVNREIAVSGFGQWQPSSSVSPDTFFVYVYTKTAANAIITLINQTITRTQADFSTGHFQFEIALDCMAGDLITLNLDYRDTKGSLLQSYEYTTTSGGIDLSTQKVFVEISGQMAAGINPVLNNLSIISPTNRVQNPGFEVDLPPWVIDSSGRTGVVNDPRTGTWALTLASGEVNYRIDQDNPVAYTSTTPGYIYQPSIFQNGKSYYIEFYTKNLDAFSYASNVVIAGFIDQPNSYQDTSQNISIISVYAYNSTTNTKGPLITWVKTGKAYAKTSLVFAAVTGFDALYFEMAPASFTSTAVKSAQTTLLSQVAQVVISNAGAGISYNPEYTFLIAVRYALAAIVRIDDVRVSELIPTIPNPINMTTKEMRLRGFTSQYIS